MALTNYGTIVPSWALDWLMPLLTPEELSITLYTIRKTWGLRRSAARISIAQFSRGYQANGRRYDAGTGLSERLVRSTLKPLKQYKVIDELAPPLSGIRAGALLRPCWYGEIRWRELDQRRRARISATVARLGETAEEVEPFDWEAILKQNVNEYDFDLFAATFRIKQVDYDYQEAVAHAEKKEKKARAQRDDEYLPGLPNPKLRPGRETVLQAMSAEVGKKGVDPKQMTAIVDSVLDLLGKRSLANQNSDHGDRVLGEAQRVAISLVGLGFDAPDKIERLEVVWRTTWNYKKAIKDGVDDVRPTANQVVDTAAQYAEQQRKGAARKEKEAVPEPPVPTRVISSAAVHMFEEEK